MRATLLLLMVFTGCRLLPEGRVGGDCRDGADNDGDGLFDCFDDGCAGSPDCLPPPVDEDPDPEDPWDTGSWDTGEWDDDWDFYSYLWAGEAAVEVGVSYEGTLDLRMWSETDGTMACWYQWTASGTPLTSCPDCEFAFETRFFDGGTVEGTRCEEWGLIPVMAPWSIGFAREWDYWGYAYTNAVLYEYYDYWVPIGTGSFDGGAFSFETYEGYFYY